MKLNPISVCRKLRIRESFYRILMGLFEFWGKTNCISFYPVRNDDEETRIALPDRFEMHAYLLIGRPNLVAPSARPHRIGKRKSLSADLMDIQGSIVGDLKAPSALNSVLKNEWAAIKKSIN
jgi:hypothetical protein